MNSCGQDSGPLATKSDSGRTAVITSRASGEIQKIGDDGEHDRHRDAALALRLAGAAGPSVGDVGVGQRGDGGDSAS